MHRVLGSMFNRQALRVTHAQSEGQGALAPPCMMHRMSGYDSNAYVLRNGMNQLFDLTPHRWVHIGVDCGSRWLEFAPVSAPAGRLATDRVA